MSASAILGIETSCDETAAAVVTDGREVRSSVVATQYELHAPFSGVVPELASRAHVERITGVIETALREASAQAQDLAAIAVTNRPGLVGSLLVGLTAAKTLAWAHHLPLIGVDHVHAHLYAPLLDSDPLEGNAIGLVVSGGHTALYLTNERCTPQILGKTIDDAAGEAFDKAAVMLGLGHPGGPALDRLAATGNDRAFDLPAANLGRDRLDFSFSGLKTALLYTLHGGHPPEPGVEPDLSGTRRADLAASFQRAVCRAIVRNVRRAMQRHPDARTLLAGGGVVANSRLRLELAELCEESGVRLRLPPLQYCIDNAAMIAGFAWPRWCRGDVDDLSLSAFPKRDDRHA